MLSSTTTPGVRRVGCHDAKESSETLDEGGNDFFGRPSLNCLQQTDPELLEFLREELLWPPFSVEHDTSLFEAYKPRHDGWIGR